MSGSAFRADVRWHQPVDPRRVERFVAERSTQYGR